MPIKLDKPIYGSVEVANILGVNLRTVYRYIQRGQLQAIHLDTAKTGGKLRLGFKKEDIIEFLGAKQHEK